jgi:triacylglycerol esterase/lipase EstA (alpha/beta hydrolase family)
MSISHFIRILINYIKSAVSDLILLIVVFVTFPIDLTKKEKRKSGPMPILLVHGYMHSSAAWLYVSYRLKKAGLGPIYTINLGSSSHTIEEYAAKIKEKANKITEQTGKHDLLLVGHSMGGLVCAYYALHMAPRNSIKGVITLGSPLEGTRMAFFGKGACAKQMRYQSYFTRKLTKNIACSEQIRFAHIWSRVDLMIRPAISAMGDSPYSYCEEIEGAGHLDFLYSPDAVSKVVAYAATFSQQI